MAESQPGRGRGRGRGGGRGRAFGQKRPHEFTEDYSGNPAGYTKKRKIMDDVYRFLVREDLVRAVIGKGGDNIKVIKEEAKAAGIETKVSIYAQGANGAPLMEGSLDRVMSVQTTSLEGLHMALAHLAPALQIHKNRRTSYSGGSQKLELRLIVPTHCCSGIIGKGGSVIRQIKEETKSYIQVYTLPLPLSEEYCVRIQNFEAPDLITTAARIFETIADIKGKNPITMYDPLYFEHGEYGDTGSYIDTEWYQEALRSGAAKPTPFREVQGGRQRGPYHGHLPYSQGYEQYGESYEYGHQDYGYEGYGYEGYGYEDPYYYDYNYEYVPQEPRVRGRAMPRGRGAFPSRGPPRGRGYAGKPRGSSRGNKIGSNYNGEEAKMDVKEEPMEYSDAALVPQPIE